MQKSRVSCKLKKKSIACGKVQCKRRVDSVAASPREYLVRRPAKNVISPSPKPPQNPPHKKKQCKIVQRARAPRAAHTNTAVYKPWSNYTTLRYNYNGSYNYKSTTLHYNYN